MAQSRCPRSECNGTTFDMEPIEPRGSKFRYMAIQCASCGAVVGTADANNIPHLIFQLAQKLKITLG